MSSRVPSKDYGKQYRAILPQLLPELERVFLEESPILGAPLERFETEFAAHTGCAHAVGTGSGTDALLLSLRALGIGAGDEVITASNTFFATVTAILMSGAQPILVDPDPGSMLLDAKGVEAALCSRTKAVIPVHLYGHLCDMEPMMQLCAAADIPIVEDAAQAHGASRNGRRAGAFGTLGCFSFHPSKNLGAFGDGGMITCSDGGLADRISELRNLGKTGKYEFGHVAPNSKLDSLQAAILLCKLPGLDGNNAIRRQHASIYGQELSDIGELILPDLSGGEEQVFHLFVVRTNRRDALLKFLREQDIQASMHYPIPPHRQEAGLALGYAKGQLPIAESLAGLVLSLPIAPELTDDQILRVCRGVREFFEVR